MRGHVHDADALFFTKLALIHREGRSPLFTENTRMVLLANRASTKYDSRKLGLQYYRRRVSLLSPFNVLRLSCLATLCMVDYRSFTAQRLNP